MSDREHSMPGNAAPVGHEVRDVAIRPIVTAAGGLAVVLVLTAVLMLWLFDYFAARQARESPPANPLAASAGRLLPPEPRLQTHPIRDLHDLRARESATLSSYGWVDRQSGVVRIPIERAMDLLAERQAAAAAPPSGRRRR